MKKPTPTRFCFNTVHAAEYIDVKVTTLRQWAREGIIKAYKKDGKQLFWLRQDLEQLITRLPAPGSRYATTLKIAAGPKKILPMSVTKST